MSDKSKPVASPAGRVVYVPMDRPATNKQRRIGGSEHDGFNDKLIVQVIRSQWAPKGQTEDEHGDQALAALLGMMALNPANEVEGMIAAQAMAMHAQVMECSRRAMLPDQPSEVSVGLRKGAAQASRAFCELLAALDRRRGKGTTQRVTVKHVHVHAGGQAIVGTVAAADTGGGGGPKREGEPRAPPAGLAHDPTVGAVMPPMRRANAKRGPLPSARHAERPVPASRRKIDGSADG